MDFCITNYANVFNVLGNWYSKRTYKPQLYPFRKNERFNAKGKRKSPTQRSFTNTNSKDFDELVNSSTEASNDSTAVLSSVDTHLSLHIFGVKQCETVSTGSTVVSTTSAPVIDPPTVLSTPTIGSVSIALTFLSSSPSHCSDPPIVPAQSAIELPSKPKTPSVSVHSDSNDENETDSNDHKNTDSIAKSDIDNENKSDTESGDCSYTDSGGSGDSGTVTSGESYCGLDCESSGHMPVTAAMLAYVRKTKRKENAVPISTKEEKSATPNTHPSLEMKLSPDEIAIAQALNRDTHHSVSPSVRMPVLFLSSSSIMSQVSGILGIDTPITDEAISFRQVHSQILPSFKLYIHSPGHSQVLFFTADSQFGPKNYWTIIGHVINPAAIPALIVDICVAVPIYDLPQQLQQAISDEITFDDQTYNQAKAMACEIEILSCTAIVNGKGSILCHLIIHNGIVLKTNLALLNKVRTPTPMPSIAATKRTNTPMPSITENGAFYEQSLPNINTNDQIITADNIILELGQVRSMSVDPTLVGAAVEKKEDTEADADQEDTPMIDSNTHSK